MYYLQDVVVIAIWCAICIAIGYMLGYVVGFAYGKKKGYDVGVVAGKRTAWVEMKEITERRVVLLNKEDKYVQS
jgi:hypothetical protein